MNPIKQHYRLKKPCANCPFLKEGAIPLSRGRLEGIISTLIEDDHSTFQCHKTVHSKRGGNWDVGADGKLTHRGCGQKLGLVMPLSPGFHDTQWD